MARFTITISSEALENLKKAQEILEKKLGGGRITQGFAIGYALKQLVDNEKKDEEK